MLVLLLAVGFFGSIAKAESLARDEAGVESDSSPRGARTRPNLIFILADDLGYGDLGCYGQREIATPHLDRMAAEGLRFTQHYAGSTVCAPSRACLLTGQHTGHVHQRANGEIQFRLDPDDPCVATRLREAGYATAMIGKSGLACLSTDPRLPNRKGFDHFFGYLDHAKAHRYFPRRLVADGEWIDYPGNRGKEGGTYSGDVILEDALAWITRHREGPFFLHLALQQPHFDLSVPERWRNLYRGRFEEVALPPSGYRAEPLPKATFAGMVSYLDDSVGRVLAKLRELRLESDTLVLFASDNGPLQEAGWSCEHFDSNGPLRGGKRDLYEGGIRVPMLAWWPEAVRAGGVTDHVSAFWDFAPTACELAGCAAPEATDGLSFVPTLLGRDEQPRHEHLYWEFYERGGKQAVRSGDWKAVRVNALKEDPSPIELYNLSADPGEQQDVAAEHPETVRRLATIMSQSHQSTPKFRMPTPSEIADQ